MIRNESLWSVAARTESFVYVNDEAVGWCQYGPADEFPRIDNNRNYRGLAPQSSGIRLWRIPCFVVGKKHRRRGVASVGLEAALESIRRKGGGLVEAYPLMQWEKVRHSEIRRRGHAPSFGNVSTHGTVSMFAKQGFKKAGSYGSLNIVMRKMI